MVVVKESVIKNFKKSTKPYLRDVKIGYTGVDISYGDEKQAMRFVSQNIAIGVARDLQRYGDFRAFEVNE